MNGIRIESRLSRAIGVGFALVLVLMLALLAVGLLRMAVMNAKIQTIVNENNLKTDLAHTMKNALRDRAIIMHSISVQTDPFEQDNEYLRFNDLGTSYSSARAQLVPLLTGDAEQRILDTMNVLTLQTQPLVVEAVSLAMNARQPEARTLIGRRIIPLQRQLLESIENLIVLERQMTQQEFTAASEAYQNTKVLMLALGGSAGLIGLVIAVVVLRTTRRQAKLLQHQALYDALTDLPNRTLFDDRLQQTILFARREQVAFALINMDLDRFKDINDSLGHEAGDRVLQEVAMRVRGVLRDSDTIARMGGDEFNILLPTTADGEGAKAVAKKILAALDESLAWGGRQIEMGGSLGIALFPEHAQDSAALIRAADAAMYAAKQAQDGFRLYNPEIERKSDDRLALQADLRRGITNHELVLYYQPKIDCATNAIGGAEALVRWQHPQHGLLYPDRFIALAEETGLIKSLTLEVLDLAIRQCKAWQQQGLNLAVAVNASAYNIQDPGFPAQVMQVLERYGLPPRLLELEMTETAVLTEPERAIACIRELGQHGIQVSIDDFGTGYSSISSLKELLVAKIKIDRSFVRDMTSSHRDAVIVRSTIELGHNLGLKVVAEGVENEGAWEELKNLGCDSAQGFHMARPLDAEKFLDWLRQSPWGKVA
jgi:diguanylate cyclase (GGDEF)-like protein